MLLSLVDSLRCPAEHPESPLVLSTAAWSGTRVASGVLGCPTCHARYPIQRGVVDFTGGSAGVPQLPDESLESEGMRLAAQLGLGEPGGLVLLTGRYCGLAAELQSLVDVTCLLVDAVGETSSGAVRFKLLGRVPLVGGSLRGAAVDEPRNMSPFLGEAARCVRPRGRLVASARSPQPSGVHVIARDEREWVAEVESPVSVTPLRRATIR